MTDFTKPGLYKCRDGSKSEVLACRNGKLYGINSRGQSSNWSPANGAWIEGDTSSYDLIGPWVEEVKKVERWVNIYSDCGGVLTCHQTEQNADFYSDNDRIACRRITYTTGAPKRVEECLDIAGEAYEGRCHLDRLENAINAFLKAYAVGRIMDTTSE